MLFGLGLALSEMTNPAVVLGFLDIFGAWNPSLMWVMSGAVIVAMISYQLKRRQLKPILADHWLVPITKELDRKLVLGASLFGIGWGLSGYCPGPGLTALVNYPQEGLYFVTSLIAGSAIFQWQSHRNHV
nr:YeeE/YedE family protein [Marinomonas ostreistagni]